MKHRRLVACMAVLALAGGLGMIATTAASAAPVHAGDRSQPQVPAQVGNGFENWIADDYTVNNGFVYAPDTNPDQAYFTTGPDTWFQWELKSGTTYDGYDTYWLCSNGSSHHCLQDEEGPVDVEDYAATGGQYWFFVPYGTEGYYEICNYYWTVKSDTACAGMLDDNGYVEATPGLFDPMSLEPV
jgi:hypothetical protein